MSPSAIAEQAITAGLDLIAISDHNAAGNSTALKEYSRVQAGEISCFYGIEAQTREEVHILCLFDEAGAALDFGDFLDGYLPPVENDEEYFGMQLIVDEHEEVKQKVDKLLSNSLNLSTTQLARKTYEYGGVAIPAHICRQAYGIVTQLGFIPTIEGEPFEALELSAETGMEKLKQLVPDWKQFGIVKFSDAHTLDQIGKISTLFAMEEPTIEEFRKALRGDEDRGILEYRKNQEPAEENNGPES